MVAEVSGCEVWCSLSGLRGFGGLLWMAMVDGIPVVQGAVHTRIRMLSTERAPSRRPPPIY